MINFIRNKIYPRSGRYYFFIGIFSLFNIILLVIVAPKLASPFVSDSFEYQETAKYLVGQSVVDYFPHRLLKPFALWLFGLGSFLMNIKTSFLFVNSVFYFFVGFLVFKIADILFGDKRQAVISSIFLLTAYPMLEYGISYMTDLSGWFFFILSVYLTLMFLKKPSYKLASLNGFVSALGMLSKESGGMGTLFFTLVLIFAFNETLKNKIKYFLVFCGSFLLPFSLWQTFVYLKFHYSYYDWYLFNRGAGSSIYKKEIFKLVIKSLGASFLLGWIFVLAGAVKLKKDKQISAQTKRILLLLIPPSFSFLLWFAASSRLFYIIGLLLSLMAGYGIVVLFKNKKIFQIISVSFVLSGNYFWFIFDDKLRSFLNYFLNIHY